MNLLKMKDANLRYSKKVHLFRKAVLFWLQITHGFQIGNNIKLANIAVQFRNFLWRHF